MVPWISDNFIELAGALAGILYVFLEIRQNIWLWPVGIITSGLYIAVFFTGRLYADMLLQVYYLIISVAGWIWWSRKANDQDGNNLLSSRLQISGITRSLAIVLIIILIFLQLVMYYILRSFTDSPVPFWDSFITSFSIVATWMLARKIIEHWYLWIIVNISATILFFSRGLYPTMILYIIYGIMSVVGLISWRKMKTEGK